MEFSLQLNRSDNEANRLFKCRLFSARGVEFAGYISGIMGEKKALVGGEGSTTKKPSQER